MTTKAELTRRVAELETALREIDAIVGAPIANAGDAARRLGAIQERIARALYAPQDV